MNACPKCETLLYKRSFAGTRIDGCPSCGGSWFSDGDLEALGGTGERLAAVDRQFRPGLQPADSRAVAMCPRCDAALVETPHPTLPGLVVDACGACRGVFLDHGKATLIADARGISDAQAASPGIPDDCSLGPSVAALTMPIPSHEGTDFDPRAELILRAVAIPAALLLAYLFMHSDGLRRLGSIFMSMWVHELGHTSMAWLSGHFAIPLPWMTWTGDGRNPLVMLLVTGAILSLGLLALRERRWTTAAAAAALLAVQVIATGLASRQTASAMITFFGDGGQLVLGAVLMLCVYARPGTKIYEGWLRWGLLVIGAVAFADALHTWLPARSDFGEIPFGMQSRAGLSDASRLVEHFGWDERALIRRHIRLAQACALVLGVAYVSGLVRSYREVRADRD